MTDPYRAQGAQSTALLQTASAVAAPALAMASALAALATVAWWHGQRGKTLAIDTMFTEPACMGHMLTVLLQQIQPPASVFQAAIHIKLTWYRHLAGQATVPPDTLRAWVAVVAVFATSAHGGASLRPMAGKTIW